MGTAFLGASGTISPPVEQTKKAGKGWTGMHVLSRGRGMGRRSNQTWGEKGSLTEPGCWSLRFLQFIVLERSVEDRARYIREPRSLGPRRFPFSGMSYDARQKCSMQNSQNVPPKKVWKCMPWTHEVGASESRRMRPTARMTERPSIYTSISPGPGVSGQRINKRVLYRTICVAYSVHLHPFRDGRPLVSLELPSASSC